MGRYFGSRHLAQYVAKVYLGYFVTLLVGVVCVFLVADFGDRIKAFWDRSWAEVALLYGYKAVLAVYQLTPAAMLLAAAACLSTLRQRGEYTALLSLGGSPRLVFSVVATCSLLVSGGLTAFDEWVVREAGTRIDELQTSRFNNWGDWRAFYAPKRWFRKGDWVLYVRGEASAAQISDVALWRLSPDFEVAQRIDAHSMRYLQEGRWQLERVASRQFGLQSEARFEEKALDEVVLPGTTGDSFRIQGGRPEQLSTGELLTQVARRAEAGLSTARWAVAFHNRFAYPLTGLVAAVLVMVLGSRRGRRGHLTLALVEGVAVAAIIWSVSLTCRALALSSHLAPWLAAWGPVLFVGALAWGWYAWRERYA
jgi:lipopolysaccharide export system permease protein